MVAGPLDFIDAKAARMAVEQADQRLSELFEEFRFNFFEIRRPEMTGGSIAGNGRVEPSVLLQQAVEERDSRHWDFAIMLTASELVGNYSSFCFAALSRPLDAAVLSMSLIDPMVLGVEANRDERVERIARRLGRIVDHRPQRIGMDGSTADGRIRRIARPDDRSPRCELRIAALFPTHYLCRRRTLNGARFGFSRSEPSLPQAALVTYLTAPSNRHPLHRSSSQCLSSSLGRSKGSAITCPPR